MKTLALAFALITATASVAYAGVTVRYYNKDSQNHTFPALCSGSKYELKATSSTTGSYTIQGSGPCKVTHAGGEVELKGGENIEIKDGKITVK